jgi:hypothetical protein
MNELSGLLWAGPKRFHLRRIRCQLVYHSRLLHTALQLTSQYVFILPWKNLAH